MKKIGISMIGSGFMGKLHTLALQSYPVYYYPPAVEIERECLIAHNPKRAENDRERFGFRRSSTDWRELLEDDRTKAVIVATPNYLHKEMVLELAKAGKHILCEKPLGMNEKEAWEMYMAAKKANIIHAVGHNNRALSGIRMMKKLIEQGKFGTIYSIQMRYIQSWGMDPETPMQWRFEAKKAGTGTLGDTGSHALDIGRYLLGDIRRVCSLNNTYIKERNITENALLSKTQNNMEILGKHRVDVDDDTKSVVEFENGVSGFLWSSRFCMGHEDTLDIEVYGSEGAGRFSRERPNELEAVFRSDGDELRGFRKIKMGPAHPNGELWPMADLGVGYVEQKCVEYRDFFWAIAKEEESLVACSFYDGFKACQAVDAIKRSAETQKWETIDNHKQEEE